MKLLVTGGAGFIGSNFVRLLLARQPGHGRGARRAHLRRARKENLDGLPDRSSFVHGDIRDPDAVAAAMRGCDVVVNFAAESHVDRSIEAPGEFIQTDVSACSCCSRRRGAPASRFVQVTTDEVYGEVLEGALDRGLAAEPAPPYAASKAGGDRLAYAYWRTYGLPVVVTRCSNNYGPYQYPEKLVPLFVTNAIDDEPLPVYGDGLNVRDWLHVDDHCDAR